MFESLAGRYSIWISVTDGSKSNRGVAPRRAKNPLLVDLGPQCYRVWDLRHFEDLRRLAARSIGIQFPAIAFWRDSGGASRRQVARRIRSEVNPSGHRRLRRTDSHCERRTRKST